MAAGIISSDINELNGLMIELHVYGCHGGIGGRDRQTTCYGIGRHIVIDAGTGLATVPLEQLANIDHVVLTHAHLDHVACLPLMLDSVAGMRKSPVTVWASNEVINLLKAHVLNDQIWPDFTKIPSVAAPFMRFASLTAEGAEIAGYRFTPLPADHGIPACGYLVARGSAAVAFSGDTGDCPEFWAQIAAEPQLKAVVVECSYPATMVPMALLSRHMHSTGLIERLRALPAKVSAVIVHRKPGLETEIADDLHRGLNDRDVRLPEPGDVYQFE